MSLKLLSIIASVLALLAGCSKPTTQDRALLTSKTLSVPPLTSSTEPFYKDPEYILDATVTTSSVETSVQNLAASVKLDPSKTYKVEIRIYPAK